MSLPAIFGTTLAAIPAQVPYLHADPVLIELGDPCWFALWIKLMRRSPVPTRFGIRDYLSTIPDRNRLARAARCRHGSVEIVSAGAVCSTRRTARGQADQLAGRGRHGADPGLGGRFPVIELPGRTDDFGETAAILPSLDLVISPCSAVAHLAGGSGVRVGSPSRTSGIGDGSPSARIARGIPPSVSFDNPNSEIGSRFSGGSDCLRPELEGKGDSRGHEAA